MRDLERRFNAGPGHWENLRDATVTEIEHAISIVTFPEQKAPHLKLTLQGITERYGSLTLDFLARYQTRKIRDWLEQFPGVGPNTSAAVVNFSTLRRRALTVDANHLRVIQRLCVVPRADAATTEHRLMRLVPETWDAAMLDEHHSLIKLHAQTLCTFSDPQCKPCPLLPHLPHRPAQHRRTPPRHPPIEPGNRCIYTYRNPSRTIALSSNLSSNSATLVIHLDTPSRQQLLPRPSTRLHANRPQPRMTRRFRVIRRIAQRNAILRAQLQLAQRRIKNIRVRLRLLRIIRARLLIHHVLNPQQSSCTLSKSSLLAELASATSIPAAFTRSRNSFAIGSGFTRGM